LPPLPTTIPLKTLRLTPLLLLAACAAPKATVIDEPKKKEQVKAIAQEPVMPQTDEADQLRLPSDLLDKLPETSQFHSTNPNLPTTKANDGAAVIAKPPAETPR
jgi:hypothetical protein